MFLKHNNCVALPLASSFLYTLRTQSIGRPGNMAAQDSTSIQRDPTQSLPQGVQELGVESFLRSLLPFVDCQQLSTVISALHPVIVQGRWKLYPGDPKSMNGHTRDIYKHVPTISEAIIDVAEGVLQKLATSRFYHQSCSDIDDRNDTFPAGVVGCQPLVEGVSLDSMKPGGIRSAVKVVIWVFQKGNTYELVEQVSTTFPLHRRGRLIQYGISTESPAIIP